MIDEPVIEIEQLGKRYGGTPRLWRKLGAAGAEEEHDEYDDDDDDDDEEIEEEPRKLWPGDAAEAREGYALRRVSLALGRGEGLAVIGANGSGKSTLTKILMRITPPSEGRVLVRGRVMPVLESASGFLQPDLTIRENALVLGELLGAERSRVASRTEQILKFAELDEEPDTPLKRMSAGMARRLAFAVAVQTEPDVLVADDDLAVGDASFRERCLERVAELMRSGMALVLATHDLALARRMCSRGIWLVNGEVAAAGSVEEVADRYERSLPFVGAQSVKRKDVSASAEIGLAGVVDHHGRPLTELEGDLPAEVHFELVVKRADLTVRCGTTLSEGGVARLRAVQPDPVTLADPGTYHVRVLYPPGLLSDGSYTGRVRVWLHEDYGEVSILRDGAYALVVRDATAPVLPVEPQPRKDLAWTVARVPGL